MPQLSSLTMDEKRCTKCGTVKPLSEFYKRTKSRDGHAYKCKACEKAYKAANVEAIAARGKAWNASHKEERAAYDKVYRAANKGKVAARKRAYYAAHREAIAADRKAYYATHKEERLAYAKAYRAAHKEEIAAREKAYAATRKEEIAAYNKVYNAAHREEAAARKKAYNAAHKEEKSASAHNRRVAGGVTLTAQVVRDIKARAGGVCCYCGEDFEDGHIDHILPVSRGGTNDPENLVYVCARCNLQKHDKTGEEFLLYRLSTEAQHDRAYKIHTF